MVLPEGVEDSDKFLRIEIKKQFVDAPIPYIRITKE